MSTLYLYIVFFQFDTGYKKVAILRVFHNKKEPSQWATPLWLVGIKMASAFYGDLTRSRQSLDLTWYRELQYTVFELGLDILGLDLVTYVETTLH